ncbi:MAG TPA: hypothetical protein DC036_01635 [Alphaproteobacteria bacterium]|jgi:hypothetical protein|nr:hypothetical protein [Rhodospirillaceae bacterium]HBD51171.1 hypothetical protein [Alphaproteobacteria bacterium]HCA14947.1 hypothetical protein [Alphaproteobacteria bacterium]HCA90415.1 hypothetical protein [Alphaproteobacteria bacterium]|tara:strand:- start:144 stop:452 length:309 start_codon:yes stop_codon:yes gene_type:complete
MSRLDEAETRFAEAMKALETALERRLAAASNSEAEDSGAGDREAGDSGSYDGGSVDGGSVDGAMMRAELARIDEQVSRAMQLISDAQQSDLTSVTVGEEGRA